MNKPTISIIVCIAKNRGIGKDNKLLFEIPDDLKRFKKITLGHPVIMGLNTFKSIGRVLPGRLNIILSSEKIDISGAKVAASIDKALKIAQNEKSDEIFFIGGGMVYHQAIKLADKLYLTIVESQKEADIYFPDYSEFSKIVFEESKVWNSYKYKFLELERR